jgi:DNA-binding transcriptional MerR regulator
MAATKQPAGVLTLPELVEALPAVLASGYDGARSGRVRDLPDARTVRWYQTLGMVDRPTAFRGRTALYSRRHLLQLASIKKLQSSGFPLADIQRGLAGKTDAELARSVDISPKDADRVINQAVRDRSRAETAKINAAFAGDENPPSRRASAFWKDRPAATAVSPSIVSAPKTMQSASLGASGMLLWNGRELTASEYATLIQLARPVVAFLESVQSSAAGTKAEGVPQAASSPRRPEEGARR